MSKRRGVAFLKNIKGVKIWICSGLWSCAKDGGVFALLLQMRRREDGGVVVLQWWRAAAFSGEEDGREVVAPWCAGWMRVGGGAKQDGDGHGGSGWMRVTADSPDCNVSFGNVKCE